MRSLGSVNRLGLLLFFLLLDRGKRKKRRSPSRLTEPSDLIFIFIFIFIFFIGLVSPVGSLVRHNFATILPQNYLIVAPFLPQFQGTKGLPARQYRHRPPCPKWATA
jgi:hypothetical protein